MKNKVLIIVVAIILALVILLSISYHFRDRRTYELNIPVIEQIKKIEIEKLATGISTEDKDKIKDITDVIIGVKRITTKESIQDSPINVQDEIKVDFYSSDNKIYTVYLYKKNTRYYIEQAYNGIYEISADEFNSIAKYISNSNTTTPYIPDGMNIADENEDKIPATEKEYNSDSNNVTIEVLKDTITNTSLEILITDNNKDQYGWGVEFRVQKKNNDKWEDLKYISDDLAWIDIAYELNNENQLKQKLNIEKYYGKLSSGLYRVVKPVYDNGYIDIYSNEFEIK